MLPNIGCCKRLACSQSSVVAPEGLRISRVRASRAGKGGFREGDVSQIVQENIHRPLAHTLFEVSNI